MPMKYQNILYNRLYEHLNANTFVSQCTYLYEESEDRAFNVQAHSDSRAEYLALAHSPAFFLPFILRVHLASSHTLIFLFPLYLRFFFVVFFVMFFVHRVRLVSPLSISKKQIVSQSFCFSLMKLYGPRDRPRVVVFFLRAAEGWPSKARRSVLPGL